MDGGKTNLDEALEGIDESKRSALRRMIVKSAFVAPVVASFAMAGLTVDGFLRTASAASGPNTTHPFS
jgi:hypothetical protein